MIDALNKLRKLKGRSLAELRVRGAQALATHLERAGLSPLARVPSDVAFFRLLEGSRAGGEMKTAAGWLERFRLRESPHFFAGFREESATRESLRSRFTDANAAVISRAERIVDGRFDLLGLRDLTFGSTVDWHLEPLSGVRAPLVHWSRINFLEPRVSGDKKIVWELNRHQMFQSLGRAYWRTGDERFAEGFVRYASEWMDANPPKLGINWASSLEVALRSISWLWALHFFKTSAHLTPQVFLRLSKFLYLHARHLETYLSTYFSPNTHLTGEALGLFYLGTLLPEFKEAARWRETGRRILLDELERHVRADGVYFEQATYYHRYTADFYTHFTLLARENGDAVDARLTLRLTALLDHLMYVTRPDRTTPLIGDDDGGRLVMLDERQADDFRATLSNGAALFKRADYKFVAGEAAEETLWLFGPEGLADFDALDAREPAGCSRAFPDGGYYVMRDGWSSDSNYMLLDCGPHGAEEIGCGHAHADALSFVLSARGRTTLVDPGTYTYTGSREERDRFRSTAAHNALTVDGESSSEPGEGAFKWARVARSDARCWIASERFDFFNGSHDGFLGLDPPVEYARAVLFLKGDYWVVLDRVCPRPAGTDLPGGPHLYETHFNFGADAEPSIETHGEVSVMRAGGPSGPCLELLAPRADGAWRQRRGWASRCYGAREAAAVCTRSTVIDSPFDFPVFMLPRPTGTCRAAQLEELEAEGGRGFELRLDGWRDILLVRAAGGVVKTSDVASDFDWTWLRFSEAADALEEIIVISGRKLCLNGSEVVTCEGTAEHVGYLAARRVGERWDVAGAGSGRLQTATPAQLNPLAAVLDAGGAEGEESSYVRD